jgi:hypothetical protein
MLPRLEIGAGNTTPKRDGWINADRHPGPNIDVVFDASQPWPFKPNSVSEVHANHVLEHLHDPNVFMREAYRVIAPSRLTSLYLRVPYGPSEAGFGDITHVRYFTPTAFICWHPNYNELSRNRQYNVQEVPFELHGVYRRIDPRLRWLVKPVIREVGLKIIPFLWGGYCELIVGMRPVKDGAYNPSMATPCADVICKHEYEGRELKDGEKLEYIHFE